MVASAFYYLVCGVATVGQRERAIDNFRMLIEHGFADIRDMQRDPDLKSLHRDPLFRELIARALRTVHASAQRTN